MHFKTIREFHWITKIVIILTGLLFVLLIAAAAAEVYWMSNRDNQAVFNFSQGLGMMVLSLSSILMQAFLLILAVIAIWMAAARIRMWMEKYLDAMLAAQKAGKEETAAALSTMTGKMEGMEKKLEKIERILENVAE